MKTLNTLIISSLVAISVCANVNAAELSTPTEKMNQVLQSQIDRKVDLSLQAANWDKSQAMLLKTSATPENVVNQKLLARRS